MKFKRIGRVLVCLLLVSALLINASPIKAKATGIGATAFITAASTVLTPAGMVVGATFIALGLAAATNPEGFQNMVDAGVSALESAGTWVKDGMVELLRTEDADGNASYYVDSGLMEDVRSWAYDSGTVASAMGLSYDNPALNPNLFWSTVPFGLCTFTCSDSNTYFVATYAKSRCVVYCGYEVGHEYLKNSLTKETGNGYYYTCAYGSGSIPSFYSSYPYLGDFTSSQLNSYPTNGESWGGAFKYVAANCALDFVASADVSLGVFPSVSVDGTSARQWSEDYTDRGLKVYGGGSGNNNNDGKWFWPLVLTLTAAELYAMSQADQWAAQTPAEFDDYAEVEELEILSRPEVDFAQGVELAPVTTPDTGGDTGSDTGTESGNQTDYTSWFQKIVKGIEELPSKFADWFNSISEKLSSIWETLKTIPQTILDGLRNILTELFVPQEDYLTDKLTSLRERFSFADSIIDTGKAIGTALATGEAEPPVIYIHLEDTEGSYNIGGTTPFLDMRWYARFKPVGDKLLSSLIWIFFIWRCFVHAPNIISGIAGDVEALNIPDGGGMYLSGSHSPFEGGPYEKVKRGRFERRTKRRR